MFINKIDYDLVVAIIPIPIQSIARSGHRNADYSRYLHACFALAPPTFISMKTFDRLKKVIDIGFWVSVLVFLGRVG